MHYNSSAPFLRYITSIHDDVMRLFLSTLFFIGLGVIACTTTQKVNTGDMAMEFKQYHLAIQLFKKELQRTNYEDVRARKSFLLGVCYEKLNDIPAALRWYQKAYENGYGEQALFKYAQMLKRDEQYDAAIDILTSLVRSERANIQYRKELTAVKQAREWVKQDPQAYEVELLGMNSSHTDFQARIFNSKTLYFTSDRRSSTGEDLYKWTGQKFMDVYELPLDKLNGEVTQTSLPINTEGHESTPTFHPDGMDFVFCRCTDANLQYDNYCLLYHAKQMDGRWSRMELLPFMKKGVNYMHPVFSSDGEELFFVSDDPDGFGRYDIWSVSFKDGQWGTAVNLGKRINTEGQELFPSVDGDTLYFSTDFRSGMGGLDIFKTHFSSQLGWLPPDHLPYPINSGGDDMSYVPIKKTSSAAIEEGIIASSRKGGMGADDLYRYYKYPVPEDTTEDEVSNLELEVSVKGEIYNLIGDPNSGIADYETLENADLSIVVQGKLKSGKTNEKGRYTFDIKPDKEYFIMAGAEGYLNKSTTFSSFGIEADKGRTKTYLVDIVLPQKITNREIVLENIYYDFDKAEIRPDAAKVLDSLATLFQDNPSLQIEMGSHTDCRGEEQYNYDLSLRRAQSAVNYLVQKGISPQRLRAKGYGETQPAVDCVCEYCTEEEYQKNRRTTFKILE